MTIGAALNTLAFRHCEVFTADGTFVVPNDVSLVIVHMVGGGAGGGGAWAGGTLAGCAGSGAGESIIQYAVAVTPGASIPVVVGAGGFGGVRLATYGASGGTSSFGDVVAFGAFIGTSNAGAGSTNGRRGGGCGGRTGASTSNGAVGVLENSFSHLGGGGGGGITNGGTVPYLGAMAPGCSGSAAAVAGGGGGPGGGGAGTMWGMGGRGGDSGAHATGSTAGEGQPGVGYGSGGGGPGYNTTSGTHTDQGTGGAGASGVVMVFYP